MEKIICKHDRVEQIADITRLRDGKVFEDIIVEWCEECYAHFINTEELGLDE